MRWVRGTETQYSQDPHAQTDDSQTYNHNCRYSPQGASVPRPTLASPAQESCTAKTSTQSVWLKACLPLCTPEGLAYGRARELQETEAPLLKGVPQTSHTPRPHTETVI